MKQYIKTLGLLLVITMVLYSCQSGQKAVSHQVAIENMTFSPAELDANIGDTIVFINKDIFVHNVTEKDSLWQSPDLNQGDTWTWIVEGNANYYCTYHPNMVGSISLMK